MADKKTDLPVTVMQFSVAGEPSRNYIVAPTTTEIPRSKPMPFLMGRDGKLYVEKSLVPDGAKRFVVEIRAEK